jgi:C_GCAxxG_C_C family probable redox protein
MSDKVKGAVETYQTTGFNCAQSVLSEFAEQFGMDRDTAMRISCGLGSGMGRSGNMCGAVTSGMLVLGLKYGMADPGSQSDKEKTYEKALIMLDRIMAIHGSANCTDLMGVDLGTPEGLLQAQEQELSDKVCSKLVGDVTRILEELLEPRNRD